MKILFRGLRTEGKGWVEGDLLTKHPHHGENWTIVHGGVIYTEVIPETVGQFVFQKGDMRVFEGDKVLVHGSYGICETSVIKAIFGFTLAENRTLINNYACLGAIKEIIGNAHEE